jgi:tetratricopeptide (TPR) repeat protein
MLDIRDLEKRWLHYKIKSYIPHAVIALSVLIILSITLYVWDSSDTQEEIVASQDKTPSIGKEISIETVLYQNTPLRTSTNQTPPPIEPQKPMIQKTTSVASKKMLIEPSLNFMKKMQSETSPYYNQSNHNQIIAPKKKKKVLKAKPIIEETQEVLVDETDNKVEEQAIEKVHKINIERHNAKDDIAEIIQRFKKNNNPALSLFVAKKYYELGEYKKAYNYALMTNKINNEIESSWIIFAKSLVKLGEKDMAIKTLQAYIRSSDSNNAHVLLEEIRSGKFR